MSTPPAAASVRAWGFGGPHSPWEGSGPLCGAAKALGPSECARVRMGAHVCVHVLYTGAAQARQPGPTIQGQCSQARRAGVQRRMPTCTLIAAAHTLTPLCPESAPEPSARCSCTCPDVPCPGTQSCSNALSSSCLVPAQPCEGARCAAVHLAAALPDHESLEHVSRRGSSCQGTSRELGLRL